MTKAIRVSLVLAVTVLLPCVTLLAQTTGPTSVEVQATKLTNTDGKVWVCLWKEGQAEGFPRCDIGKPLAKLSAPASAPTVTFNNVLPGAYAVSLFHDEKGTGLIETNLVGLPKSAVGLSNNPPLGITTPPTFAKALFVVPDVVHLVIEVRHVF